MFLKDYTNIDYLKLTAKATTIPILLVLLGSWVKLIWLTLIDCISLFPSLVSETASVAKATAGTPWSREEAEVEK